VNQFLRDNKFHFVRFLQLMGIQQFTTTSASEEEMVKVFALHREDNRFNQYETKVLSCGLPRIFYSTKKET